MTTKQVHNGAVKCLALSTQQGKLFTGSFHDETIKVWEIGTLKRVHTIKNAYVTCLLIDEAAEKLYSGSADWQINIWCMTYYHSYRSISTEGQVYKLALDPKSKRLYCACDRTTTVSVWDTDSLESVGVFKGQDEHQDERITSLCIAEDGKRLYCGRAKGSIEVWDTVTNACVATLQGHSDWVCSLCLSLKRNRLISASRDKTIRV
jgi:WD40 repeat protein